MNSETWGQILLCNHIRKEGNPFLSSTSISSQVSVAPVSNFAQTQLLREASKMSSDGELDKRRDPCNLINQGDVIESYIP